MNLYVALLRGINVGGNNIIKMADLAACFAGLGLHRVRTYIQSGNVIFGADEPAPANLVGLLEGALSGAFNYNSTVVLRSHAAMQAVVAQAPDGFGGEPDVYRYDVIFLKEPLTSAEAMNWVSAKEGVDQINAGDGVLYASRLISRASQSRLAKIVSSPVYRSLTIRNWNTTTKLLHMLDSAANVNG